MNKKQQNNQTTHQLAPPPYPSPKGRGVKCTVCLSFACRKETSTKPNNLLTRKLAYYPQGVSW